MAVCWSLTCSPQRYKCWEVNLGMLMGPVCKVSSSHIPLHVRDTQADSAGEQSLKALYWHAAAQPQLCACPACQAARLSLLGGGS